MNIFSEFALIYTKCFSNQKSPGITARASLVVEMVGVEPTSKNISEGLSPSAVRALHFAESAVTRTHYGSTILLVPYDTRSSRKSFLHE